jgi:hypothetical protein
VNSPTLGLLQLRNYLYNVDGVIHALVSLRGDLHHFTNSKTKQPGTPFTHDYYEGITHFMEILCRVVLKAEIAALLPKQGRPINMIVTLPD